MRLATASYQQAPSGQRLQSQSLDAKCVSASKATMESLRISALGMPIAAD